MLHKAHHALPVIGHHRDGRPIHLVAGASPDDTPEQVSAPADITELSTDELAALHARAVAEFDTIYADPAGPAADALSRATDVADIIELCRSEQGRRVEEAQQAADRFAAQRERVHGATSGDTPDPGGVSGDGGTAQPVPEPVPEPAPAADNVVASTTPTTPTDRLRLDAGRRSLNAYLRDAANFAPNPRILGPRTESVLVASGDIPDYPVGTKLSRMAQLAGAMSARARNLSVSRSGKRATRVPIAYLERDHRFLLDEKASPAQINAVLTAATDPANLVASGGWCAPPTTSYDFFNIVCEDGLVDLPTVGVPRGSMQWPVSPSFADIMGLDDNPWTWTNADDIAALTGPDEKPCQRVACAELDDATLACDGICLTVGNLVDYAWPELVENHTRLLMAAHAHYMNMRRLNALAAGSTPVTVPSIGAGFVAPLLSALELQATDMRELFRMCDEAVIEAILPRWVIGAVRADLALRQGRADMSVARTMLADWLDERNIRVQWVTDWQVGGAGQPGGATPATSWPTTIQAIVYPPGTWVLGQGLRLNLGIIRDSVLNAKNDHTAAFMEDCHLLARIGHQSRLVSMDVCANGNTHAGEILDCAVS